MWLLLSPPALAEGLSQTSIGGKLVVDDSMGAAGGFSLGILNDDVGIWAAFGPKDALGKSVRAWRVEAGAWGPLSSDPEVPAVPEDPEAPPEPPDRPDPVLAVPHLYVGGDAWRSERFAGGFDLYGLFDVPALAGVPATTFYAGPAAGAGLGVTYPRGGGEGRGAVLLGGGAYAGVFVAEVFFARLRALARLDPFVPGDGGLDGGAILGVSLREAGAPVALTVGGEATRGYGADDPVRWQANTTLQYVMGD